MLTDNVRSKLSALSRRLEEIDRMLAAPETAADMNLFRDLSRERGEIEPIVGRLHAYERAESDLAAAQELAADPEMKAFAAEESAAATHELERIEQELRIALLPKDPNDDRNIFLEIRAGTGGDEAALFGADLLRMYQRYAERHGFKAEFLSENMTEMGGVKEVVLSLSGRGAYSRMKFESGVHRVQRVPETESQGRIHTSAATVAVLPEAEDVEVEINPNDLQIDTYRSGGAGGQHVNKTESAIRITHLPTGLVVQCQDERSQHKNKEKAMRVLKSRLLELYQNEAAAAEATSRRSQVGSGDRSERIRTYNFPQGRVTDHRIGLTLYKIDAIMNGDLDEVIDALVTADQAERMKRGEGGE